MKADDAAVAGFFEDLPVLMFVLAGVLVLVVSSAWASSASLQARTESDLEHSAETLAGHVLDRIRGESPLPMVSSVEGARLAEMAAEVATGIEYSISLLERYPHPRLLMIESSGDPDQAVATGSCCSLFNAKDDSGMVVVLEVRVLVWQV